MKVSELIGSQVLSLSDATMCGTVCGVIPSADLKKIKALEVFMNDEDDCEKKYLETSRIVAADGTVTIKNTDMLVMCYPVSSHSPINLPAYSERGESYGRVTDVEIDEKYNVTSILVAERSFALGDTLNRSDNLIIFRLPGSKTKIAKTKKKVPTVKTEPAAEQTADRTVRITSAKRYSFLMGRRLSDDVTDFAGERIAGKGSVVTDELIRLAKERGAIVKLTMAAM